MFFSKYKQLVLGLAILLICLQMTFYGVLREHSTYSRQMAPRRPVTTKAPKSVQEPTTVREKAAERADSPPDPKTLWLITVYYKNELFKTMQEQYYQLALQKYSKLINMRLRFRNDFVAGKTVNIDDPFDEGRDIVYVYQNELQQFHFQSLLEKLTDLNLGTFNFQSNLCLNEIKEDNSQDTTVAADHATFTVKNETKCHGAMLIQRRMNTYADLPNMVRTANGEVDFLKAEPKWTYPMKTDDFPFAFFNQEENPWRPKLFRLPKTECTAQIPTMIKTSIDNFDFRQHIRDNFLPEFKGKHLQKFFVIGRKKDEDFSKELLDEMEQYDDFVVGDFVDSYLNLTMKTFVAHTFAQEHCHEAEWVVLHDDDAIVDWRKALKGLLENTKQLNLRCFYSPPRRELPMRLGRNHVSAFQYPIGHTFPKFCHGPCMAATAAASKAILAAAQTTNWRSLPVEDVLFNGVMRTVAGVDNISLMGGVCRHVDLVKENGRNRKFTREEKLKRITELVKEFNPE